MMKPTATTCMAISLLMPKREHAMGISNSEPPATPEAPQAPKVAMILSTKALGSDTSIPRVWHVAKLIMVIVMAAPFMLMVLPRGMLTE